MKPQNKSSFLAWLSCLFAILIFTTLANPLGNQLGTESSVARVIDTSAWGPEINGVSMRVMYPEAVYFGDSLPLSLDFRTRLSSQTTSVLQSVADTGIDRVILRLIDMADGRAVELQPTSYAGASDMLSEDTLSSLPAHRIVFSTGTPRMVHDATSEYLARQCIPRERPKFLHQVGLSPGTYTAQVEVFAAKSDPSRWSGLLLSPVFTIHIEPRSVIDSSVVLVIPKQLRISEGPLIDYDSQHVDTIGLSIRPHHRTHLRLSVDEWSGTFRGLHCLPTILLNPYLPSGHKERDYVLQPPTRLWTLDGKRTFVVNMSIDEVFDRMRQGRRKSYPQRTRTLWHDSLVVSFDTRDFDSLIPHMGSVYEYHTLLLPKRMHIAPDSLWYGLDDVTVQEVQIPRGFMIIGEIDLGSGGRLLCDLLPQETVLPHHESHIQLSSLDSLMVNVYAMAPWADTAGVDTSLLGQLLLRSYGIDTLQHEIGSPHIIPLQERYAQPQQQFWHSITYQIPKHLELSDDLQLTADTSDAMQLKILRKPGTAMFACLTASPWHCRDLQPDLLGLSEQLTWAEHSNDTLQVNYTLYERPIGQWWNDNIEALFTYTYSILLEKGHLKELEKEREKHIDRERNSRFPGLIGH